AGDGARALRRALVAAMTVAGLGPEAIGGMVLAANEVVANAYRYAGGPPEVRAGSADGRFVCEITDSGTGFDDPLAGHLPPRARGDRGAGLWIAARARRGLRCSGARAARRSGSGPSVGANRRPVRPSAPPSYPRPGRLDADADRRVVHVG